MNFLAVIRAVAELPAALRELSAEVRRLNGVMASARANERKDRKDDEVDEAIARALHTAGPDDGDDGLPSH